MANAVTQQQLDETLELFEKYGKDEITFERLKEVVNNYAARILSEQHLISFTFNEMETGRFRIRPTGVSALTPYGEKRLAEIREA